MESIGIDLGSRKSHYCIRSASNEVCSEGSVKTAEIGVWLMSQARSRITVETCTEAFAVADLAMTAGHEVSVVPAAVVRQLGVAPRRASAQSRNSGPRQGASDGPRSIAACANYAASFPRTRCTRSRTTEACQCSQKHNFARS